MIFEPPSGCIVRVSEPDRNQTNPFYGVRQTLTFDRLNLGLVSTRFRIEIRGAKSKFTATFSANLPRGSPLTVHHAKTPLRQPDFMLTIHPENVVRSRSSRIGGSHAKEESREETGNRGMIARRQDRDPQASGMRVTEANGRAGAVRPGSPPTADLSKLTD
jgi:hypothetical protein